MTPETVPDELRGRLDSAAAPLVLVDEAGLIAFVNACAAQALGSGRELLGRPAALLLPGWVPLHSASGSAPEYPSKFLLLAPANAPAGPAPDSAPRGMSATPPPAARSMPDLLPSQSGAGPRRATLPEERHEATRIHSLFATTVVGVLEVAPDQRFLRANPAFRTMTGYSEQELAELTVADVLFPEDRAHAQSQIGAVAARRLSAYEADLRFRRKDGTPVWVRMSVGLDDGPPAVLTVLVLDRTDQKRLEERLQRLQFAENVGFRASCLAHDFNNLLAVISGCATFLLEGTSSTNPARALAQELVAACQRAAGLTAQLSKLNRPAPPEPEVVDLSAVAAGAARLVRPVLGPGVTLASGLTVPRLVKADPVQLEQMLLNLAINANDALTDGGVLAIETHAVRVGADRDGFPSLAPGAYVQLTVSDTGSGMTDEVKARAFEPFFTTKAVGKGTGLGLAAVHAAVEQCGGGIRAYSETGVGTVFKILLPALAPGADPAPEPDRATADRAATALLVGPAGPRRRLARLALRTEGHPVLEAENGSAALRALQDASGAIDLVVTSAAEPGLAALRDNCPDAIVVALRDTTDAPGAHRDRAADGGPVVPFPFTPFSFALAVRAALNEQGASR